MGADTTGIAQRRVALLLLPLRLWIGLGWLRAGIANALQPEWLDGTTLIRFLHGLAVAAVPTVGAVLPEQGVDDPGFTLLGLLLLVALLAMTLTRATHRAADPGAVQPPLDDPLGLGFP